MPFLDLSKETPSFYQDRLGTNRGKALKKEMMGFLREGAQISERLPQLLHLRQWCGTPPFSDDDGKSHFLLLVENDPLPRQARDWDIGNALVKTRAFFTQG
jgi:hypothetical protein